MDEQKLDKVMRALEHCSTDEPCSKDKYINCPYTPRMCNNPDYNCARAMAKDALELLKEQKWYGEHCGDCDEPTLDDWTRGE